MAKHPMGLCMRRPSQASHGCLRSPDHHEDIEGDEIIWAFLRPGSSGQSGQKMLKALEKTRHHEEPVESSFLYDQVAALLCYDPSVRAGERNASSGMSAAAGRVWSVLGDRRLFDRTAVDGLRGELAWLSEALG